MIADLRRVLPGLHVVVVNDGSTDDTEVVARRAGAVVLTHPYRLGYGAALQTGYIFALRNGYERALQIDGDGQHDASQAAALLTVIRDGRADMALGSRFLSGRPQAMPLVRRFGSATLRRLGRALAGITCTDPTSGFRAFNRRALAVLVSDEFPTDYPDLDVLIRLRFAGVRIAEISASVRERTGGTSMHSGLRPLYYAYKVALASVMATIRGRRARRSSA
ncbi:MAG: glycosyltransferase family 2 protein [Chloroflexota bacterium]|nr:glycosyltransferase family 2 protein [Chloroflexota bacterium]